MADNSGFAGLITRILSGLSIGGPPSSSVTPTPAPAPAPTPTPTAPVDPTAPPPTSAATAASLYPASSPPAPRDPYTGAATSGPDPYTGNYGAGGIGSDYAVSSRRTTASVYGAGGIGSDYAATGPAQTSSGEDSSGKNVADTLSSAAGGMGYPAAGIGPLAWATGAPTIGEANQALAGVFNEQKQQPARIGGWGAAYNNPGNLEKGGWTSRQPGYQPTAPGRFATFDTMQHGLDALQANLRAYGARGINTPAGIAKPWAPPFENNTALYGGVLANAAGAPNVNAPLDMSDPWTYNRLASGVGQIEMGVPPAKIANAITSAPQNRVFADAANTALQLYGVNPAVARGY